MKTSRLLKGHTDYIRSVLAVGDSNTLVRGSACYVLFCFGENGKRSITFANQL